MKKLVVLTGAGISAESGLKTFRDANGLWEGHDVMEVASPIGFANNPELVLEFYNQRRRQLHEVKPNDAHHALAKLEEHFQVEIITQNVDDLHERSGSTNVLHLHGELRKMRSTTDPGHIKEISGDILVGDLCPKGGQWRPHIVWFGEAVPAIPKAAELCNQADILLVIGTSLLVYPAAGLVHYAPDKSPIYVVDPSVPEVSRPNVRYLEMKATEGMKILMNELMAYV